MLLLFWFEFGAITNMHDWKEIIHCKEIQYSNYIYLFFKKKLKVVRWKLVTLIGVSIWDFWGGQVPMLFVDCTSIRQVYFGDWFYDSSYKLKINNY